VDHAIVLQLAQQGCYLQRMSVLKWKLNRHARRLLSPAPDPGFQPGGYDSHLTHTRSPAARGRHNPRSREPGWPGGGRRGGLG
jgi:hypothetical protein